MILVALSMVAIVAMAALSIDVVTLYLARMEAQRAADAGALAGARIISVSGLTGDPSDNSGYWPQICGGSSGTATQAALAAAQEVTVGSVAPTVTVTYTAGGTTQPNCSGLPSAFGVNPLVNVQVTRSNLPTFFSRVWGNTGNSVTATATAEAYNASNSANVGNGSGGTIIPVQPRCVKPWIVPNYDPLHPSSACTTNCNHFVDQSSGSIVNSGISLSGGSANGVIGETFWLSANCIHTGGGCSFRATPIQANLTGNSYVNGPPNLLYYPGHAPSSVVAVPSCSSGEDLYQQAIAGCDQSTAYQCGVQRMNTVDLSENPSIQNGDTAQGLQCLIHEGSTTAGQPDGQDTLNDSSYPFKMLAGSSNPLVGGGLSNGSQISASNSVVSLPIYDPGNTVNSSGTSQVTVVGFLQVFVQQVDQWDNMKVTVLNVVGCSNGNGQPVGTAVAGSSPVPVRLITPP
ncbi:MAG TPA: pilus assembly protein TadG-related protein [Verrucomicrobiae bacterium]|nr:pilus assembly protein TadG-related protein [Verrucomicrobiae bacterium]